MKTIGLPLMTAQERAERVSALTQQRAEGISTAGAIQFALQVYSELPEPRQPQDQADIESLVSISNALDLRLRNLDIALRSFEVRELMLGQ